MHKSGILSVIACIALICSLEVTLSFSANADNKIVAIADATQSTTSTAGGTAATTDGLLSFGAGYLHEFGSASRMGFETGLIYLQRSYGQSGVLTYKSNWIQVPFTAHLHSMGFSFGAGTYLSYGFGNLATDTAGVITTSTLSSSQKKWDYGVQGALGYLVANRILLEIRYSVGLANLATNTSNSQKFNDAQLVLGFCF